MTGIVERRLPGRAFDDKSQGIGQPVIGAGHGKHAVKKPVLLIRYNNLPFVAQVTALNLLPENPHRIYLNIQNQGAVNIFVSFGSQSGGLSIVPNNGFEWNINAPQNAVYVYTLAGSSNCILIEGTR